FLTSAHVTLPSTLYSQKRMGNFVVKQNKIIYTYIKNRAHGTEENMGGYAAHSLAIMTDAVHLLTDFGSIVMSLVSLWISSRPHTKTMTFGWHRAEILGVLLSVLSIWVVTGLLVVTAVHRIIDGHYEIQSQIMLITSVCAVVVNILHSHSHGFPYSQLQTGEEQRGHSHGNASVKAAFVHVVGDLLQSLGVLLAAIIIHVWPDYKIADPICTFLFSVLVLGSTFTVSKDVFRILMEGSPHHMNFNAVRESLLSMEGVKATHSLHMWGLNMSHALLSVHVAVEEDADTQTVLMKATKLLRSNFGFSTITIQVERYSPEMLHCSQCQDLTD
uniref:Probable proton-coupled zinc antiporter SLC30A3 n=1 Tax=Myripristis murdjan TaxID=586833 RepID=A0A668AS80_9TELE